MCMTFTVAKMKPGHQADVPGVEEERGGGYSHILAVRVCAAGKGI